MPPSPQRHAATVPSLVRQQTGAGRTDTGCARAGSTSRRRSAFQAFTQQPIHHPLGLAVWLRRRQGRHYARLVFVRPNAAVQFFGSTR